MSALRELAFASIVLGAAAAFASACAASARPVADPAPQRTEPAPQPPPSPPPAEPLAGPAPDAGAAAARDRPPPVPRTGKTWPFHAWTRAEAVTFNRFEMRPRVQLRAYDENGFSPHLVDRKPLSPELAKVALNLVNQTEGDVMVSKCSFPRHAVVLYDGDLPVASINVCFECGDITLWPPWTPERDPWKRLTEKEERELAAVEKKRLMLYDKAFPRWKTFFRDDVGFPIDERR